MPTPLTWIRSFEAAARRGSLTMAATELGLTQAAISQHIAALESRLRVQLFQREPRGVSLTGAGAQLYRDVADGLERIDGALSRFGRRENDRLRIVCNASLAVRWLQPRLPVFCRAHPDLSVETRIALWQTDALGVEADVEIFHGTGRPGRTFALPGGELIAVAGVDLLQSESGLEARTPIRIISALGFETMFKAWTGELRERHRRLLRGYEVDSFQTALSMVEAGLGITIVPRLLAQDAIDGSRIVELPPPAQLPKVAYWCELRERSTVAAEAFQYWLAEEAARSAPKTTAVA